jgi:hypothetical protein
MEIIALLVIVASLGFSLFTFLRLRSYNRYLADARIAVAYKQKVKLQAPLGEWLQWANMLGKDQQSNGRVVYRMGHTTVAILKPRPGHGKTKTRTIKEKQAA